MSEGHLSNWASPGKSWFLGIGINEYSEFPPLTNAVRDVEEIKKLLEQSYDLTPGCIFTLFDAEASKENIIDKLDYFGKSIDTLDKLIIYYSGHGKVNQDTDIGYWIPVDGKQKSSAGYILNSTIRQYVKGIDAKHILLISDSCFSGSMFVKGVSRSTKVVEELNALPSRWAICSGRDDEEVYDGAPGGHSPFAQSLINYLSNAPSDYINVGRVVNHVIEETAANYEQLPDGRPMFNVGHGGGQYIFTKKNAAPKVPAFQESPSQDPTQRAGVSRKAEIKVEHVPPPPEVKIPEEIAEEVRALITKGDLKKAFSRLSSETEDMGVAFKNNLNSFESKFSNLKKQVRMGIISSADASLERNQITFGLLDLISA